MNDNMFNRSVNYKKGAIFSSERLLNILLLSNILLLIGSFFMIGCGAYFIIEHLDFAPDVMGTGVAKYASSILIISGCFVMTSTVFGIIGGMAKSRNILYFYAVLLAVSFGLSVISASMAITFRSWVSGRYLENYMSGTLKNRYGDKSYEELTKHWDRAQMKWYCCGVRDRGWSVYRASRWFSMNRTNQPDQTGPYVPPSCCLMDQYGAYLNLQKCTHYRLGPPGIQSGLPNEYIFHKGCYKAGWEFVHSITGYLLVLSILPAFSMILLINLALFVSCAL